MSKKKVSPNQMSFFDSPARDVTLSHSKEALEFVLARKVSELIAGQADFDRCIIDRQAWEEGAKVKHYPYVRIDGQMWTVKHCKAVVAFLDRWKQRRSNLEHDIRNLRNAIERL